jgi:hypothetical protein
MRPPSEKPATNPPSRPSRDKTVAAGEIGAADRSRAPLPHEHDESSHSQASAAPEQQRVGRQAHSDAVGVQQNTDRGPVLDELYDRMASPQRERESPRQ